MTIQVSYYFILETIPNFHSFLKSLAFQPLTCLLGFASLHTSLLSLPSLPLSFPYFTHPSQNQLFLWILHGIMLRNQSMRYFRIALL